MKLFSKNKLQKRLAASLKGVYRIGRGKQQIIRFYNEMFQYDLEEAYANLVRGLDKESVEVIDQILGRFHYISKQKKDYIDLYNAKEKAEFQELSTHFEQRVVKLAENCYSYNGYKLPIDHFESSVFYYKHGIEKLSTLDMIKEKNIIDVGGFIGDSAIILAEHTNKDVYSFEPVSENHDHLLKTISMNRVGNIKPQKMGLGSRVERLSISVNGSGSRISKTNEKAEIIDVSTLDYFVEANRIEVGLIKADIEGFEPEFLKGAENTIRTQRPTLILSMYHNPHDFFFLKPQIEKWGLGYTFKIFKPLVKWDFYAETTLIAEAI